MGNNVSIIYRDDLYPNKPPQFEANPLYYPFQTDGPFGDSLHFNWRCGEPSVKLSCARITEFLYWVYGIKTESPAGVGFTFTEYTNVEFIRRNSQDEMLASSTRDLLAALLEVAELIDARTEIPVEKYSTVKMMLEKHLSSTP